MPSFGCDGLTYLAQLTLTNNAANFGDVLCGGRSGRESEGLEGRR